MSKARLDVTMVARGLAETRQKAQALIIAGLVLVNGKPAGKSGEAVAEDAQITLKEAGCPYVSRGGWKLEKAMEAFGLTLEGRVCADIGASTGGFTDCMLKKGASLVYAVEVGYGQLALSLREDPRVVVMERTNARFLNEKSFPQKASFASIDVSFISLKLILPALHLAGIQEIAALIKPQFEAGREAIGKHGVVRDPEIHKQVIRQTLAYETGFYPWALTYSPVKGPKGNIEFLVHLKREECPQPPDENTILRVVEEAHAELDIQK